MKVLETLLLCGAISLCPSLSAAQDAAAAEVLFRDGVKLLEQKNFQAACPKLAESHRLDPGTGTLLALAACYEGGRKFSSAWAAYTEAGARARRENQKEREQYANDRAKDLQPKLSKLVIAVAIGGLSLAELEIKRDGVVLGRASWGTPMPVDGGEHVIEASASGYTTWRTTLSVADEGDAKTVEIPALAPLAAPSAGGPSATTGATPADQGPAPARDSGKSFRIAGLVIGGVGVVGLGVGGFFTVQAMNKNDESKENCVGNLCQQAGFDARKDAIDAGNLATIGFAAGGTLLAGGTILYIVGASRKPSSESASLTAAPLISPSALGFAAAGRF